MADLSVAVKVLMLGRLDASSAVTSLVPASRIFPMKVEALPSYPFIRYGLPEVIPYENSCGEGVQLDVPLHVFAQSEEAAQAICAEVALALDNYGAFQDCDWVRTVFMEERTGDVWHGVVTFRVTHTA